VQRRDFIKVIAGSAVAWPLAALAQQPTMPVIGFLSGASPDGYAKMTAGFRQGLKETGYVEGQNVAIEYRWANEQYDRLSALAADLVRRQVLVIAASGTPANLVAKTATSTIPIVFTSGGDAVSNGLVASLNRPGGNATGVVTLNTELVQKRLQLLHELVPTASVIALLVNPSGPALAGPQSNRVLSAAHTLGLELQVLNAGTEPDLDVVFAKLIQLRAGGLVISGDPFFNSRPTLLGNLCARHAVPAIFEFREFAAAGGLVSYGADLPDAYRLAGVYVARILKGEKPADLPVQQVTKIEMIINLETAKALGLKIPEPLIGRADEVIE
jgi:putative tryptophan/tyrosine transport system substrate-binding protein